MLEAEGVLLREKKTESNAKALQGKSVDLRAGTTGKVASLVQVQETLRRTASVASDLEAKPECNICRSRAITSNY